MESDLYIVSVAVVAGFAFVAGVLVGVLVAWAGYRQRLRAFGRIWQD